MNFLEVNNNTNDPYYQKYMKYKMKYIELKDFADQEGGAISGKSMILFSSSNKKIINIINIKANKIKEYIESNLKIKKSTEEDKFGRLDKKKKGEMGNFEDIWNSKFLTPTQQKLDKEARDVYPIYDKYFDLSRSLEFKGFIGNIGKAELILIADKDKNDFVAKYNALLKELIKFDNIIISDSKNIKKQLISSIEKNIKAIIGISNSLNKLKLDTSYEKILSVINAKVESLKVTYKTYIDGVSEEISKNLLEKNNEARESIKAEMSNSIPWADYTKSIKLGVPINSGSFNQIIEFMNTQTNNKFNLDSYVIVDVKGKIIYLEHFIGQATNADKTTEPAADPAAAGEASEAAPEAAPEGDGASAYLYSPDTSSLTDTISLTDF